MKIMKNTILIFFFLLLVNNGFSQEKIEIKWMEKYQWKELSNQENENIHLIEVIPEDENEENWTILGQIMAVKNLKMPLEEVENMLFDEIKKTSADAKLIFIEKKDNIKYPWILFKIENQRDENNYESQLWYLRQGETSLFVNFIAIKEQKLKQNFVEEWSAIFKLSEIVKIKE